MKEVCWHALGAHTQLHSRYCFNQPTLFRPTQPLESCPQVISALELIIVAEADKAATAAEQATQL